MIELSVGNIVRDKKTQAEVMIISKMPDRYNKNEFYYIGIYDIEFREDVNYNRIPFPRAIKIRTNEELEQYEIIGKVE